MLANGTDQKNSVTAVIKSGGSERLYPHYDENVWLRTCEKEVTNPLTGEIKGTIPTWLNGTLLRNGGGRLKYGKDEFKHLFDSSALIHRFGIKNGKITYQCKFLQTDAYKKNLANDRIVMNEFGTSIAPDPCQSIFSRLSTMFQTTEPSDNANISLYPFGDEIYAFSESRVIHKVNVENLSTEGKIQINDHIAILHNTSHPHVDKDGSVYNLGLTLKSRKPHHIIICHPKGKTGKEMVANSYVASSIPAQWPFHPSYMHSFGMTENYFIIVEQPLTLSVPKIVFAQMMSSSISSSITWYPGEKARFNVLSRKTGKLCRSFLAETFFYFHIIHQYEKDDHIVMDICTYDDGSVLDSVYIESIRNMQSNPDYGKSLRARPDRFVLPLKPEPKSKKNGNLVTLKGTLAEAHYESNGDILVTPERICEYGCELPRMNYDYLGKPYRYFYAVNTDADMKSCGSIVKVDTQTKETKIWGQQNGVVSEPIFVPAPNPQSEDDGVVLASMVFKDDENRVALIVLNGQTFEEIARASFRTPSAVTKSFHGWFVPT